MNEKCFTRNPLVRDGTSQDQRLLETLLPAYVAVDERSMTDLAEFAFKFASEIRFYENGISDPSLLGDWTDFFKLTDDWTDFSLEEFLEELKIDQQTKPHLALFFGFLYMFKIAQDDINTITQRHLDFYYRDVLQLKEKPAEPDQVAIIFKLAKHVNAHLIKKGTILKAGKDDTGVELFYKVDKDVAVNKATVSELKAVFADKNNGHLLYASPIANSADGKGEKLKTEEQSWKTFGKPTDDFERDLAVVGFAFASPVLHLAEGARTFTLQLKTTTNLNTLNLQDTSIEVFFSGEKEWILANDWEIVKGEPKKINKELTIRAQLIPDQDAVVAYDKEVLLEPFDTTYPVVKVVLNQNEPDPLIYKKLKDLVIEQANLHVQVKGVKNLVLQNDQAVLDANKPFLPFGNRPHKGSNFYIGSWEVFQKQLASLTLNFQWDNLPEDATGFHGYYANYLGARRDNPGFQIRMSMLDKKEWKPMPSNADLVNLFTDLEGKPIKSKAKLPTEDERSLLSVILPETTGSIADDENMETFSELTNDTRKGFMRMTLKGQDFGHKIFAKSFSIKSIELAKFEQSAALEIDSQFGSADKIQARFDAGPKGETQLIISEQIQAELGVDPRVFKTEAQKRAAKVLVDSLRRGDFVETPQLPNEPYTPTIKDLSIDYTSEAVIEFKVDSGFNLATTFSASIAGASSNKILDSFSKKTLGNLTERSLNKGFRSPPKKENNTRSKTIADFLKSKKKSVRETEKELITGSTNETEINKGIIELFHVHPFGIQKLNLTGLSQRLLPAYEEEGNLYIGLSDLEPPQTLSVLFQHAEGSADPDANKQEIIWRYLKEDGAWGLLEKDTHILSDGTNDLLTSGIIQFDLPEDIIKDNTKLPTGKYWLWASVNSDSDAICDLIDIKAQAVSASFSDQGNDPDHLRSALPAETISKLLVSDSKIDKTTQPYASFGGKIKEQRPEFYTRISERLRHKHRAITIWDYERLILQQFPEVYKVKCINHTRFTDSENFDDYSEMIPGHVTLIIISNVFNKNAVDPLRPKTSLARIDEIQTYISSIMPPCVNIHVKNPVYEEVEVDFNVKFNKGIDAGIFKEKLKKEIKDFLSPWASDCPQEIRFGGKIHKSMILNFVEERSYVDFVTCFKMKHIVPFDEEHNDNKDVDEAIATRAVSILGSKDDHQINVIPIDSDSCHCEDNIVLNASQLASVDDCPCEDSKANSDEIDNDVPEL